MKTILLLVLILSFCLVGCDGQPGPYTNPEEQLSAAEYRGLQQGDTCVVVSTKDNHILVKYPNEDIVQALVVSESDLVSNFLFGDLVVIIIFFLAIGIFIGISIYL